jgi:hypothetical protein
MWWIVGGIVYVAVVVLALGLCKVAAWADEQAGR